MRQQALDVLRGVAILLVMSYHFDFCQFTYQVGWAGVDLFFVLSGFLISGLLFDEFIKRGRIDLMRFWVRRGFKIYPAFYVLMAATFLVLLRFHHFDAHKAFAELFFLQSYLPHIWGHTWTLAVEEHFYFGLPLLIVVLMLTSKKQRDPFIAIPWIFGMIGTACLALRWLAWRHGVPAHTIHTETHLRIDSLFAGVFISYIYRFHREQFEAIVRLPLPLLAVPFFLPVVLLPSDGEFVTIVGLSCLYIGFGMILAWAVAKPPSTNYALRSVAWIGRHSYSIYLWHLPLGALVFHGSFNLSFFITGVVVSISIGSLLSKAVEAPSILIRDRLFPDWRTSIRASANSSIALRSESSRI